MPEIRQLSQSIINKIAAGEVIERPASVVKELVENSVDAGARRVDVSIEGGGRDVIRIVDDGHGIAADQMTLALASHATSKIVTADDLFSVTSLGFRGEALASIAEISRTLIRSRAREAEAGAEIEAVGGTLSEVTPCGCPVGTSIEVRNLFFNTPVRRKFLKTVQTEFGHINEAVTRIAMPKPDVHFTLRHNDRLVLDLPTGSQFDRVAKLIGRQTADKLIPIESEHEGVRLSGYVGHPSESRSNNKSQYLFLNGRHIRDRALQHALAEAYRGLLTTGRHPVAFLFMEMPPEMCDVNVHPTKLEVRFQDSGRLYSQLLAALRTKFLGSDLSTQAEAGPSEEDPSEAHDADAASHFRQRVMDWAHGDGPPERPRRVASYGSPGAAETLRTAMRSEPVRDSLQLHTLGPGEFKPFPDATASAPAQDAEAGWADKPVDRCPGMPRLSVPEQQEAVDDGRTPLGRTTAKAIQIHDRYIIAESEHGMVVIDQHALHERILFEQFKARIENGPAESQKLLVPEPVDLSPAEHALILEHKEVLDHLGLKTEPFGGETVLVTAYPAMLSHVSPEDLLRTVLDRLGETGQVPNRTELMDGLLETMACKAAIKAGDPLSDTEIDALLQQGDEIDDGHHCPHGRPSVLTFSCEELDKQFKRT